MDSFIISRLKINHLRLIAAIAETGQIKIAANRLNITQPAASRMLAEIETIVDAKICKRNPKGLELNILGRALSARAHNMLIEMRNLSRDIDELKNGSGGVTYVGAVTGAAIRYLVPAVMQLRASSPLVDIHIKIATSDELSEDLLAGKLDFVLGRIPHNFSGDLLETHLARSEQVSFIARKGHPLSFSENISLSDLGPYQWIIQSQGLPIRDAVESALLDRNLPYPSQVLNTSSLLVTISYLSQSTSIAPIAQEVAEMMSGPEVASKIVALNVKDQIEVSPYRLMSIKDRQLSPSARRLKELVLMEIESRPAETPIYS